MAIKFSTIKNQKINKDLQNVTEHMLQEKMKTQPDENYKNQGTIIGIKEMIIINEEIPNKYFYQKEQQKQAKKQIKQLQYDQNKMPKTNLEILKECQKFYQTYKKQKNCEATQNELLNNIPKLVQTDQNRQLTKPINKNELQRAINQMKNEKSPGIDGIPIEFHKTFYKLLENDLLQLCIIILYL